MPAGLEIYGPNNTRRLTVYCKTTVFKGTYTTTVATSNSVKTLNFYVAGISPSDNLLVVSDVNTSTVVVGTGVIQVHVASAVDGSTNIYFNAGTYTINVFEVIG